MRLELLHEIFFMQLNSLFVTEHVILPLLLSKGQYLQPLRLQKLKPQFLVAFKFGGKLVFKTLLCGVSAGVSTSVGFPLVAPRWVEGLKKSVIVF
jgi:hypothetical protein